MIEIVRRRPRRDPSTVRTHPDENVLPDPHRPEGKQNRMIALPALNQRVVFFA